MTRRRLRVYELAAVAVTIGVCGMTAGAQRRSGAPPQYDPKTEVTLQVTVTRITTVEGPGAHSGSHLLVKSPLETIEVVLGPQWYLADKKYVFAVGDVITVTGARFKRANSDAIMAREIKKGEETMTFRDAKGFPLWSGRGRAGAGAAGS
jgi:hypothetical protein